MGRNKENAALWAKQKRIKERHDNAEMVRLRNKERYAYRKLNKDATFTPVSKLSPEKQQQRRDQIKERVRKCREKKRALKEQQKSSSTTTSTVSHSVYERSDGNPDGQLIGFNIECEDQQGADLLSQVQTYNDALAEQHIVILSHHDKNKVNSTHNQEIDSNFLMVSNELCVARTNRDATIPKTHISSSMDGNDNLLMTSHPIDDSIIIHKKEQQCSSAHIFGQNVIVHNSADTVDKYNSRENDKIETLFESVVPEVCSLFSSCEEQSILELFHGQDIISTDEATPKCKEQELQPKQSAAASTIEILSSDQQVPETNSSGCLQTDQYEEIEFYSDAEAELHSSVATSPLHNVGASVTSPLHQEHPNMTKENDSRSINCERYSKRKLTGSIKLMKDKTPAERERQRERNRINSQNSRTRNKLKTSKASIEVKAETIKHVPSKALSNKSKIEADKRIKRNNQRALRKVRKYQKENKEQKRKIMALQKQLQRFKNKLSAINTNSQTPKETVDDLLDGCAVPEKVRSTLLAHVTLKQQLEKYYKSLKTHREKASLTAGIIGENSSIRRNRLMNQFKFLNKLSKKEEKTRRKLNGEELQREIEKFYLSDESSRMAPGKKQTKTKNKQKEQRRFLNASLLELHKRFITETRIEVSYSTFCKYKPFYIGQIKNTEIDSCLCIIHENMDLLVSSAHKLELVSSSTGEALAYSMCCNDATEFCLARVCDTCKHKEIVIHQNQHDQEKEWFYEKWNPSKTVTRMSSKTKEAYEVKVPVKEKVECTVGELVNLLKNRLSQFMVHMTKIRHQHIATRMLKDNLRDEEIMVHVDFSENYNCSYARQIQGMHFGPAKEQVSIHTGVLYMSKNRHQAFCTMSDSMRHDAFAILTHLKPVLSKCLQENPQVHTIHFKSDGPTTQYKNKTMFGIIATSFKEYFPEIKHITWNYSESYHGKGAPDGIGACTKRSADDLVAQNNDIYSFKTLYEKLEKKLKLLLIPVYAAEINQVESKCFKNPITFQGTMEVRQVTWEKRESESQELFFNNLSCFQCDFGCECIHYSIGSMTIDPTSGPIDSNPTSTKPLFQEDNFQDVDDPHPAEINPEKLPETPTLSSLGVITAAKGTRLSELDWVVVDHDSFPVLGQIHKVFKKTINLRLLEQVDENQFVEMGNPPKIQKFNLTNVLFQTPSPPEKIWESTFYYPSWPPLKKAALDLIRERTSKSKKKQPSKE